MYLVQNDDGLFALGQRQQKWKEELFCPPYFKLKTPTTLIFSDHPLCIVLSSRNEKVIQSSCSQGIYILEELDIQRQS